MVVTIVWRYIGWRGRTLWGDDTWRVERSEDWDGRFAFSGFRLRSNRGGIVDWSV